ncbi:glycosyltransferase family 4 protein [Stutzerimonas stutzeri]|uniref:glycosyltransferase family 4 protein n=1 Tax=Stutzerimonas stutzeri TaxID=316 RepID=UPI00210C1078|nr:glycosyltransferase family 1 protein [Stutzerimonas stutzeri]MCQ4322422.1 glycosyltransferase family 4 protein [Stutzerimonas stutzeri]
MKLWINTESLTPPLTGIGNYTFNLLSALLNIPEIQQIDCFSGYRFSSASHALEKCRSACVAVHDKPGPTETPTHLAVSGTIKHRLRQSALAYSAREALRNAAVRITGCSKQRFVYHEPSFILKAHRGPSVTTIHDLSFIRYPDFHPRQRVRWLVKQLPRTLERADAIITDSEWVRQELIQTYRVDPSIVTAIHLGAAQHYRPQAAPDARQVLNRYGLRYGQYLLFIGTLEPRKGVDTLLDAFAALPTVLQHSFPLILAGASGWKNEALQTRIENVARTKTLKHLSFVPEADLPALYSGAALFIAPSLYEGFGLPTLEAMACGTPTLCTADTSMAEFSEGASSLFRRGDSCHLAEHIQHLLEHDDARSELAKKGLQRAGQLTWERCARNTYDVYRRVAV